MSLLLLFFEEYEEPDVGFGVVEIVETEDLDDPLTGTDGIEWRTFAREDFLALFFALRFAVVRLALFLTLRLAELFFAADFFAAFFFAAT